MHKVVALVITVLLLSYLGWLAFRGTPPGFRTIVVLERSSESGELPTELEIVTLLGFDAIPSIEDPRFVDVLHADETYDPDELVLGVEIDGDARAYSVPVLSRHEIVNDVVGGKPIAVTW